MCLAFLTHQTEPSERGTEAEPKAKRVCPHCIRLLSLAGVGVVWRLNERFQIFFEHCIDPFGGGDILYRLKLSAEAFYQRAL